MGTTLSQLNRGFFFPLFRLTLTALPPITSEKDSFGKKLLSKGSVLWRNGYFCFLKKKNVKLIVQTPRGRRHHLALRGEKREFRVERFLHSDAENWLG